MVIIGIDPHPGSHTAALDENGKVLEHLTVSNDKAGLKQLGSWLGSYEVEACAEAVITTVREQIEQLELAMKRIVAELMAEVLEVQGVGPVHAATLLAEAGDVRRFNSPYAGRTRASSLWFSTSDKPPATSLLPKLRP